MSYRRPHPAPAPAALLLLREVPSAEPPPPRRTHPQGDPQLACDGNLLGVRQAQLRENAAGLQPRLLQYVMRFTGLNAEFAHDVVQDALVAAWCNLDRIRDAGHLRPWLYRVARFKAVDRIRKRGPGGIPMLSLEHGTDLGVEPVSPRVGGEADEFEALRRALDALPPAYAGAVRLHHLEGKTIRETAELLGLPPSTIKMRLHRARLRLRTALERAARRDPGRWDEEG